MAQEVITHKLIYETKQAERAIRVVADRIDDLSRKKVSLPLGKVSGDIDKFGESLAASNARVLAFGATTGVIVSMQQAFKGLATNIIEVESSLANINVILQASSSNFDKFSDSLFKAANNTGSSFRVAAEAAAEFARQGLSLQNTLESTEAAMILVRISGIDATKAVEALTAATNTFNGSNLKTIDIVNKLANVDAAFATSASGLAEGLRRVGSVAVDAGVDLDQLNALIASLQQTTARGEAVIGNGLKTIFTRLGRTTVLNQLEELGINVRNASGETRGAIPILQELAGVYENLSSAQKAQISESVAGVFQINTFKAAIKDLGKETSLYGKALEISRNSTDEAEQRNAKLNETLSSLLNSLSNNLVKVSASIGEAGLEEPFRNLVNFINSSVEGLDRLLNTSSTAGSLLQGAFKGLGTFLQGPGLIALGQGLFKLFANVTSSVSGAVSLFLNLNKEQRVFNKLLEDGKIALTDQQGKELSILEIQQQINKAVAQEVAYRKSINSLGRSVAPGIRVSNKASKQILGLADGYLPSEAIQKEQEDIQKGIGGASRSAKPYFTTLNLGKGPQDVVVNTDEKIVRNINGSGKDAVFTKDMMRAYGIKTFATGADDAFSRQQQQSLIGLTPLKSVFEELEKEVKKQAQLTKEENKEKRKVGPSQRLKDIDRDILDIRKNRFRESLGLEKQPSFKEKQKIERLEKLAAQKRLTEEAKARKEAVRNEKRRSKSEQRIAQVNEARAKSVRQESLRAARFESQLKKNLQDQVRANAVTSLPKSESRGPGLNFDSLRSNKALGASIALPFIGESLNTYLKNNDVINQGQSDVLSSGIRGASTTLLAGSQFGPGGAIVAGAISGLSFIEEVSKSLGDSFKELSSQAEELKSRNTEVVNSASNFIQAGERLNSLITNGGSALDIKKASEARFEALRGIIPNAPGVAQSLLKAQATDGKTLTDVQNEIIFDFEKQSKNKSNLLDTRAAFRNIFDKENSFGTRFTESFGAANRGIDQRLSQRNGGNALTGGLDGLIGGTSGFFKRLFQSSNNVEFSKDQRNEISDVLIKSFDPSVLKGTPEQIRERILEVINSKNVGSSLKTTGLFKDIDSRTITEINQVGRNNNFSKEFGGRLFELFDNFNLLKQNEVTAKSVGSLNNAISKLVSDLSFSNNLRSQVENAAFDVEKNRIQKSFAGRSFTESSLIDANSQIDLQAIERERLNSLNDVNQKLLNDFQKLVPDVQDQETQKKLVSLLSKFQQDGDALSLGQNAIKAFGSTINGSPDSLTVKKLDQLNQGIIGELASIKTQNEKAIAIHQQNVEANRRQLDLTKSLNLFGGVNSFDKGELGKDSFNEVIRNITGFSQSKINNQLNRKSSFFGPNSSEYRNLLDSNEAIKLDQASRTLNRIQGLKDNELLPQGEAERSRLRDQAFTAKREVLNQQAKTSFQGNFLGLIQNLQKELGQNAPDLAGRVSRITNRNDVQSAIKDSDFKFLQENFGLDSIQSSARNLSNSGYINDILQEIKDLISTYSNITQGINASAIAKSEELVPLSFREQSKLAGINNSSSARVDSLSNLQNSLNLNSLISNNRSNTSSLLGGLGANLEVNQDLFSKRATLIQKQEEISRSLNSGTLRNPKDSVDQINKLGVQIENLNRQIQKNTEKNNELVKNASNVFLNNQNQPTNTPTNNIEGFLGDISGISNIGQSFDQSASRIAEANQSMETSVTNLNQTVQRFSENFKNLDQVITVNAKTEILADGKVIEDAIGKGSDAIISSFEKVVVEKIKEAFEFTIQRKAQFAPVVPNN